MGDVDERVIFCSSNVAGSSTVHDTYAHLLQGFVHGGNGCSREAVLQNALENVHHACC
jgi:hypothetical protein